MLLYIILLPVQSPARMVNRDCSHTWGVAVSLVGASSCRKTEPPPAVLVPDPRL